jgi:hypothetical protein
MPAVPLCRIARQAQVSAFTAIARAGIRPPRSVRREASDKPRIVQDTPKYPPVCFDPAGRGVLLLVTVIVYPFFADFCILACPLQMYPEMGKCISGTISYAAALVEAFVMALLHKAMIG